MGLLDRWDAANQRSVDRLGALGTDARYETSLRKRGAPGAWEALLAPIPVIGAIALLVAAWREHRRHRDTR